MLRKLKICIVSLTAYPLFEPQAEALFGGAEVRGYLIGTTLAKLPAYEVSYVVFNHNQAPVTTFGDVKVIAHPNWRAPNAPFPSLLEHYKRDVFEGGVPKKTRRFPFYELKDKHALTSLKFAAWVALAILKKTQTAIRLLTTRRRIRIESYEILWDKFGIYEEIDADLYFIFGVGSLAAIVAGFCRRAGKKFVLFIADDPNISEAYQAGATGTNAYGDPNFLCHYALEQADLIFAQTNKQAERLQNLFGRSAVVVSNPIDLKVFSPNMLPYPQRRTALWIGRADRFKKMPLRLLELARACPDIQFEVIMNSEDQTVEDEVMQSKPPNVTVYKHVPYQQIEEFVARAFVFVNTSEFEGFPNTFLQAAKYGVPILSYKIDPDGFIEKHECGIVAHGDFDKLVEGLHQIEADQQGDMCYSQNILKYVQQHDLDQKVREIDEAIQAFIAQSDLQNVQL